MSTIEKYLDFNKEELEKEIELQKERIKRSRKLIKFLKRYNNTIRKKKF